MSTQVFKCKRCTSFFPGQHTTCPKCGGEMTDITNTKTADDFLKLIGAYSPAPISYTFMTKKISTNYEGES